MNYPSGKKEAVVLSGGASQGAYHAGVLRALMNGEVPALGYENPENPDLGYKKVDPQVITGTSAGGFNAAALLSHIEGENPNPADFIEELWLDRLSRTGTSCGNRVFRFRGSLTPFIDPRCLFSNPIRPMLDLFEDANFFARESVKRGRQFHELAARIEVVHRFVF